MGCCPHEAHHTITLALQMHGHIYAQICINVHKCNDLMLSQSLKLIYKCLPFVEDDVPTLASHIPRYTGQDKTEVAIEGKKKTPGLLLVTNQCKVYVFIK